jgi:hypothetical protein
MVTASVSARIKTQDDLDFICDCRNRGKCSCLLSNASLGRHCYDQAMRGTAMFADGVGLRMTYRANEVGSDTDYRTRNRKERREIAIMFWLWICKLRERDSYHTSQT